MQACLCRYPGVFSNVNRIQTQRAFLGPRDLKEVPQKELKQWLNLLSPLPQTGSLTYIRNVPQLQQRLLCPQTRGAWQPFGSTVWLSCSGAERGVPPPHISSTSVRFALPSSFQQRPCRCLTPRARSISHFTHDATHARKSAITGAEPFERKSPTVPRFFSETVNTGCIRELVSNWQFQLWKC